MTHQKFVATSNKYPTLLGMEFDIFKGIYILVKNGQVVAQDNSSFKLVSMIPDYKTNSTDEFQLINLLLVRDDRYFIQHLHCVGNGYGLMTPQLKLIFYDEDAIENQIDCPFLIDTGATMSCIPEKLKPFPVDAAYIDIETGAGIQRQKLTKIQVNIDEHCYNVIACINQGSLCILGLDILKYYTLNIDGDKAGILIKNNLKPNLEEIFTI